MCLIYLTFFNKSIASTATAKHNTQIFITELRTKADTPHPHLLFITPYSKSRIEKGKKNEKTSNRNFNAHDYKVDLRMDESGKFKVDKPDYVTDRTIELVGPNFWNKETRIIHLGSKGLQLTVVKSGQRQKIQYLEEVKQKRNIQNDYEEGKVVLQIKFDCNPCISSKLLLVDKVGTGLFFSTYLFFIYYQGCAPERLFESPRGLTT